MPVIKKPLEKWKKSNKKEYSDKNYNKIIKAFVKLRGFDTVESYITYHYGRILDKSFDLKLKNMLKDSIGEPQINQEKPRTALVISKPILTTTTQSSALANHRMDSLPPPYTSGSYFDQYTNYFYKRYQHTNNHKKSCKSREIENFVYEDCFKNYNYVDHHNEKKSISSSVDAVDNTKKHTLFKFVEDLQCNDIKIEYLLTGRKTYPKTSEHSNSKAKNKTAGSRVDDVLSKSKISRVNEAQSDDNVYESIYVENINNKNINRNAGNERASYKKLDVDDHRASNTLIIEKPIVIAKK